MMCHLRLGPEKCTIASPEVGFEISATEPMNPDRAGAAGRPFGRPVHLAAPATVVAGGLSLFLS